MKIKIFKVSTREMFTFKDKSELIVFIYETVGTVPYNANINDLIKTLPREEYYRVK